MTRLYAPDHTPVPPQDIQRRLAQIDPSLFLKWVEGNRELGMPSTWGVCQKWEHNDPRRKMIYAGDLPHDSDHDLVAQLPEDCGADEAYGWVVNGLRRHSSKEDIQRLLNRASEYNKNRQSQVFDASHEEALNRIEVQGHKLFENSTGMKAIKVVGQSYTPRSRGIKASDL